MVKREPTLDGAASDILDGAAVRSERVLSVVRIVFCLAVLTRFLLVTELTAGRVLTTVPAIFVAVAFSGHMLAAGSRRPSPSWRFMSVTVDAVVCFMTLLPAALWPEFTYIPLLNKVDTAAILVVIMAASFRLSPAVATTSGLINGALFALLMVLDEAQPWSSVERGAVILYGFLIAGTTTLAALTAGHTRRLVRRGARKALEAELARHNLGLVLSEHHDLRTLLSSATMGADLLAREFERSPPDDSAQRHWCRLLREDLRAINHTVRQIREYSYLELLVGQHRRTVDANEEIRSVLRQLQRRFPVVTFEATYAVEPALVGLRGGAEAMGRVLHNLVVNAIEGNGNTGANRVHVEVRTTDSTVAIFIEDDGPGFPQAALNSSPQTPRTTKAEGLGFGLVFARSVVEGSGGRLTYGNRLAGGARVELILPMAPTPPAELDEPPASSQRAFIRPEHAL